MAGHDRCFCRCHNAIRGDYNNALHAGSWFQSTSLAADPFINVPRPVPTDDPLEAAVATGCCCVNRHVYALSNLPPEFPYTPPAHWTPESDASGEGSEE